MLTEDKLNFCLKTISPKAFFPIVLDAIETKKVLSVVRAADGEKELMDQFLTKGPGISDPPTGHPDKWLDNYGIRGISREELYNRIITAGTECTYFAPSISGISMNSYNVYNYFPIREHYIDNFFVNDWTNEMKEKLFKAAGHVLFINSNPNIADSMQLRVQSNLRVKVSYLKLKSWQEADEIIEKASKIDAPLTIFSGGPANKFISPKIANGGNIPKVVLDIGAAAQHWTFSHLPINRQLAEKFHQEWVNSCSI